MCPSMTSRFDTSHIQHCFLIAVHLEGTPAQLPRSKPVPVTVTLEFNGYTDKSQVHGPNRHCKKAFLRSRHARDCSHNLSIHVPASMGDAHQPLDLESVPVAQLTAGDVSRGAVESG